MKTIMVNPKTVTRKWKLIDAEGKPLGRVASAAARILMGKNKAIFSPNVDTGDFLVIINAGKVGTTGKKAEQKQYFHHTGHIGGERWITFDALIKKHPTQPLEAAIWGMLPHSSLGEKMMKKLKIYAGAEQPHTAQHLETVTLDF
ncbi:MAG: 50S ribosomal protein L13 [Fibrobacteraceae bacterium]|nr:50S ribosomal protein L13 [Fibrobacteraceae bacterium]